MHSMAHFQPAGLMLLGKLSRHSEVHSEYVLMYTPRLISRTLPIALGGTLPACLTIQFQVSSQDAPKFTRSTFSRTLPGMLSRTLLISLDGTLLACVTLSSQVHSQMTRHFRSHLTICFHVCSWVLDPKTC
jgi:hypothetical protein